MHSWLRWRSLVVGGAAMFVFVAAPRFLSAQAPVKRPLSYDTYDYWRSISGTRLSRDGQWLAYALTSQGEDGDLVVRNLKTGKDYHAPRGTNPTFTPDGRLVIFTMSPPKADDQNAQKRAGRRWPKRRRPPSRKAQARARRGRHCRADLDGHHDVGRREGDHGRSRGAIPPAGRVVDLAGLSPAERQRPRWRGGAGAPPVAGRGGAARGGTGRDARPRHAAGDRWRSGNSRAAALEKHEDPGSDLVVRNLATGDETTIAEVTDFQWNKDGSWLAYAVSSAKPESDGAFARKMADGSTLVLHQGRGHYNNLAFDAAGRQLAVLSDAAEYDKKVSPYRLYYWKAGDLAAVELVSAATKGMSAGMAVSEYGGARFSDDGARLYLGTAPPPPPPADSNAPKAIQVDLWNYHDLELQPMQKVRAQQAREQNYRAVVQLLDRRFVQLASPDLPTVNPGTDAIRAIGTSDLPYEQEMSWDATYNDVSLVDLRTGTRKKILEHFHGNASLSPGGSYVLYFDEPTGQWMTYRIADGTRTALTDRLPVKFFQENHDTPDLPGAYGVAGWTEADRSVLLYDQFDIWEVHPDGTGARMVTNGEGRKEGLVFRYRPMSSDETGGGRGGRAGGAGSVARFRRPSRCSSRRRTKTRGRLGSIASRSAARPRLKS